LIVAALRRFGSKRTLLNDFELLGLSSAEGSAFFHTQYLRAEGPFGCDANRKYNALSKRAVKSFAPECPLRGGARHRVFVRDRTSRSGSRPAPNTIRITARFTNDQLSYPRIFLSFAISRVIAFGTSRDKQTDVVPARCAATEGRRQHYPARTFKPSVLYFPSRQTTPYLLIQCIWIIAFGQRCRACGNPKAKC
jgi:hypothetical protein